MMNIKIARQHFMVIKTACLLALLFFTMQAIAVVPEAIKYQAVARDNNGNIIANRNIGIRLSILETTTSGISVYSERHAAVTNNLGLVNLEIGKGTALSGSMTDIDWGNDSHFIKIEMDDNGGSNYTLVGTSQLVSVPYALFAKEAANGTQWNDTTNNIYYNTGKVGVGTNNPKSTLEVYSNQRRGSQICITGDSPTLRLTDTAYAGNGVIIGVAADSNDLIPRSGKGDVVFTNEAYGTGGAYIFGTGVPSQPCVKITDDCKVGIGTDAPVSKLDVKGGDVNIEDIGSGVIMKSPDGNCWRLTISNTGQPVITSIACLTSGTPDPNNCLDAVACYPFSGNANDVSGNNYNGTVSGATLTTDRKGNANNAYHFNKLASDKIELPNLSVFDNAGEITMSIWAKTDSIIDYGTTIISTIPDASADRFQMNINWSGIPANTNIFDYGSISSGRLVSPATTVSFNTWEHYVFVKSTAGGFMKIYKNGVEIATKTTSAAISNKNKKVVLGGSPTNAEHSDQLFKGSLDDLKIFNRALSASEIANIYNTEK